MAPYVRVHGNQVTLVHGARDKVSGKVQQRTLFTLYSKNEARAATGDGENAQHARYFRQLLEAANPQLKFDWKDLNKQIQQKMNALPDIYPVQQQRSTESLRTTMDEFVKQLTINDPTQSAASRESLNQLAGDLRILQFLIQHRLELAALQAGHGEHSPFDHYDPFCWRNEVQGNEVPPDIEELTIDFFQSQQLERAKTLLSLLVRCFPNYAEGFNRLGLIALQEGNPKEAAEFFKTTVKVGRNRFPRRIPESDYWLDIETRPYIRGLMNLALALNQAERYTEALEVCDRLYAECGHAGKTAATAHRASAYLNLNRWQEAYDQSSLLLDHCPDEGFIAGYALFELGRKQEALELFLYAAANSPHTACLLLDAPKTKPKSSIEVEDHNAGIELCRSLLRFFHQQSAQSKKFFRRLRENTCVKALLKEVIECTRKHFSERGEQHRQNFDRWHHCKSGKNARALARAVIVELN